MDWHIDNAERGRLRELATLQREYSALPIMERRRQMWTAINDGQADAPPPVVVETETFEDEFLPPEVFRCQSKTARAIERNLLRHVRNHELISDDKVTPDTFDIGWFVDVDELGVPLEQERATDAQGRKAGYRTRHPIGDIERDLSMLKPAACRVDQERTEAWKAFLDDLLGDLLPVAIRTGLFGCTKLTHRVIDLLGMEAFFIALYEKPDAVHRLMAFLRDNALRVMRWAEGEGLLRANIGNQTSFKSSFNFTTTLVPAAGPDEPARLSDMWGYSNSQETVGIAPEMFREFCFPYYRDVCKPMGRLSWGCCEPAHPFWDDIRRLPHLAKVSISPWCDQAFMGEALRGTGIVYSRKPDPRFLGLDVSLNEAAWIAHVRETLDAARGVPTEICIRNVFTVHGNLGKVRCAVDLARQEIGRQ